MKRFGLRADVPSGRRRHGAGGACRRRRSSSECGKRKAAQESTNGCQASRTWQSRNHRDSRRRAADADGRAQGHPHDGGLRLCAAGRLHPCADARARHPQSRSMSRTAGSSRSICATDTNGRTGILSPRKISATGSRMSHKITSLSPSGLPVSMMVPGGESPHFEVLDETTVRYSWTRPNPLFLPDLAGPDPLYIYCPSHYLKQFHEKYADKAALDAWSRRTTNAIGRRCMPNWISDVP